MRQPAAVVSARPVAVVSARPVAVGSARPLVLDAAFAGIASVRRAELLPWLVVVRQHAVVLDVFFPRPVVVAGLLPDDTLRNDAVRLVAFDDLVLAGDVLRLGVPVFLDGVPPRHENY